MTTALYDLITRSRRLRPASRDAYLRSVEQFMDFCRGHPDTAALEAWRDDLERTRSPQTVNTMICGVRFAARRLAEVEHEPKLDFARAVEPLPTGEVTREPVVLTAEQCRRLLAACDASLLGLRDRAILELGLRTGMRRAEICHVAVADINDDKLSFLLKGGRRHTIRLGKKSLRWMGAWRQAARINSGRVFRSVRRSLDTPTLRDSLSPGGLYAALLRRADEAEVPFHPHCMRHTFVTLCHQLGIPEWRISAVTGHATRGNIDKYTHDLDGKPIGDLLPF